MTPPPVPDDRHQVIVDAEHLKLLRIFHFIVGGLRIAFSSIFIIHTALFALFSSGVIPLEPSGHNEPPPPWLFGLLAGLFGAFVAWGWTSGLLTIVSGFKIGRRRARTFSMVVAGINCISLPFGTILSVFTLVVLSRASVRRLYAANAGDSANHRAPVPGPGV